jgi:hypothetical protein
MTGLSLTVPHLLPLAGVRAVTSWISQLSITIEKYLRHLTYKQNVFILAHSSGDSSPSLGGAIALGLSQGWHIMVGVHGKAKALTL